MALSEREKTSTKLTEALVLARTRAGDLESVRKLNCWASQIGDASIVRQMPHLEVCSLSVNRLTSLEDFAHCPSLQELYIRKNQVGQLSDILHLRRLPKLRVLWLADNPCAGEDNYRMTVLRTLPNLQKLDNIAVLEEEINRALEEGDDLTLEGGTELLTGLTDTNADTDTDTNANTNADTDTDTDNNTNTNSNAVLYTATSQEITTDEVTTDEVTSPASASSPACHSAAMDLTSSSSPVAEEREEGEDSGVEVSAIHLQPQPSEKGPQRAVGLALAAHRSRLQEESVKLSLEETNQIRSQLGLKPLPVSKVSPHKSVTTGVTKARNANIMQSVLLLVRELDKDSLEIVHSTVQQRLDNL